MGRFSKIWNRSLDGDFKEQRSFVRYAIVITAVMLAFLFVKKDNIFRWIEAGVTIRNQEKRMEYLRRETERLDARTRLLTNDRDTLERYAREELNFSEPGDDVYLIK
ncbi:MAG: septum formation initiator family protein [Bacteroidales bacterium]|nr:septum formation initiator family protein [Bacteroidales bacterium]